MDIRSIYDHAMQAGDVQAMVDLAMLLRMGGRYCTKSVPRERDLFGRSVDGSYQNVNALGHLLRLNPDAVEKNSLLAKQLFERAIIAGDVRALFGLATMHHYGTGEVEQDDHRAKQLYERAVYGGYVPAMNGLANLLRFTPDNALKDASRAKVLYERAVENGNEFAMYNLAELLHYGDEGIPKDVPRAVELYERLVKDGDSRSMASLGYLFHQGAEGVPQDAMRAKELYERAIDAGYVEATGDLADLLRAGAADVPKDLVRANELDKQAVEAGDVPATVFLARLHRDGRDGMPKDLTRAQELFERAINIGSEDAILDLANLLSELPTRVEANTSRAKELEEMHKLVADGNLVFDTKKRQWIRPVEKKAYESMVQALYIVLDNPQLLTESFLLKWIRPQHIQTVTDMVAGHNLILLSIRAGLISQDNVRTFGGIRWLLEDNVYLGSRRLAKENPTVVGSIFQHAMNIRILGSEYALNTALDMISNFKADLKVIGDAVERLADEVENHRRLIQGGTFVQAPNNTDMQAQNTSDEQLLQSSDTVSPNKEKHEMDASGLSSGLSSLKSSLQERDHLGVSASIARCMLSLALPDKAVGGSSAPNSIQKATSIEKAEQVPSKSEGDVEETLECYSSVICFDLSNLKTLSKAFSLETLSELDGWVRCAVLHAVSASEFENLDDMRATLNKELLLRQEENSAIALVDMGSSSWLTAKTNAEKASSNAMDIEDERVQRYFHYLVCGFESEVLRLADAKVAINHLLDSTEGLAPVEKDKVEDLFFALSEDDSETVTKEVFLKIFVSIRQEQGTSVVLREHMTVLEECKKRFRTCAHPEEYLSVRMGTRVLRNLCKDLIEREVVGAQLSVHSDRIQGELSKFADKNASRLDEAGFVEAVKSLLIHQRYCELTGHTVRAAVQDKQFNSLGQTESSQP